MGLSAVPSGHVAAIVTSLEMVERPRPQPVPTVPFTIGRWPSPAPDKYRALLARVGTPWLWFSRTIMADDALSAVIGDPLVEISAVTDRNGIEVGMLELDFRVSGQAEIAYFGLVPELVGKGLGRWLMTYALASAWRSGVTRVWLHTCTLDAPNALGFYRSQGFVAYRRQVEMFADPRLTGALPRDAASQVPLITRR